MAKVTKSKIVIKKEHLEALRNDQFKPEAPVYDQEEVICIIPSGDYEVSSKLVPASGTMKSWTAYESKFTINGEEFLARYRSKVEPDESDDLAVCLFVANRDWTATSGKQIKKGEKKVFAVNAAGSEA